MTDVKEGDVKEGDVEVSSFLLECIEEPYSLEKEILGLSENEPEIDLWETENDEPSLASQTKKVKQLQSTMPNMPILHSDISEYEYLSMIKDAPYQEHIEKVSKLQSSGIPKMDIINGDKDMSAFDESHELNLKKLNYKNKYYIKRR